MRVARAATPAHPSHLLAPLPPAGDHVLLKQCGYREAIGPALLSASEGFHMDPRLEQTDRILSEMQLRIQEGDLDGMRALVDELDGLTHGDGAEESGIRPMVGR